MMTEQYENPGSRVQHAFVGMMFQFLAAVENKAEELNIQKIPLFPFYTLEPPKQHKNSSRLMKNFYLYLRTV